MSMKALLRWHWRQRAGIRAISARWTSMLGVAFVFVPSCDEGRASAALSSIDGGIDQETLQSLDAIWSKGKAAFSSPG